MFSSSDVTRHGRLWVDHEKIALLYAEMKRWGEAKSADFKLAQDYYNKTNKILGRKERTVLLQGRNLNMREARAVIAANNDVLESAIRVRQLNVKNWKAELDAAKPADKYKYVRKIAGVKTLSICLGGKDLFRKSQISQAAKRQWREKRLFMAMEGEGNRKLGNDNIRVEHLYDNRFAVFVKIQGMMVRVGETVFQKGSQDILNAQQHHRPVTAQILMKNSKFKIHVTPNVPLDTFGENQDPMLKTAGFDLNSKHFDLAVLDSCGNPFKQSFRTTSFHKADDMVISLAEVYKHLHAEGVKRVCIENLKHINRRKSSRVNGHAGRGVRSAVNQIPTKQFREANRRLCRKYDMSFAEVPAHFTSRNTVGWKEEQFGSDIHQKAAFLVGRRGLGLPIVRTKYHTVSDRQRMIASSVGLDDIPSLVQEKGVVDDLPEATGGVSQPESPD